MWQEIKSSPEVVAEILDDLRNGNTYYTGVETDKGVLLFSRDMNGEEQYKQYMYKYIENYFFDVPQSTSINKAIPIPAIKKKILILFFFTKH
mgnify:CR=1 FL=1